MNQLNKETGSASSHTLPSSGTHVLAEVVLEEISYYKCRRCKDWSMLQSYFEQNPSCIPDYEVLVATDNKLIERIIGVIPPSKKTDVLFVCPGCCEGNETSAKDFLTFSTALELAKHHEECELNDINKKYKCCSCHFATNVFKEIKNHQEFVNCNVKFLGKMKHVTYDCLCLSAACSSGKF